LKRDSTTQYALLGLLTLGPKTGYEIKKSIEESIGFFWQESFGQIYPTLKKMEQLGFVESQDSSEGSGKSKTTYKITKLGQKELKKYLESSLSKNIVRNELLLKIFFASNMDLKILKKQLEEIKKDCKSNLKLFLSIKQKNFVNCEVNNKDSIFWGFTLEYGISNMKMNLDWIQHIEKSLFPQEKK
jgi:PadR family transcriptional regulator AphA